METRWNRSKGEKKISIEIVIISFMMIVRVCNARCYMCRAFAYEGIIMEYEYRIAADIFINAETNTRICQKTFDEFTSLQQHMMLNSVCWMRNSQKSQNAQGKKMRCYSWSKSWGHMSADCPFTRLKASCVIFIVLIMSMAKLCHIDPMSAYYIKSPCE